MLRPVGPLPAAVYWRRRVLVLVLLAGVLGGGGWLGVAAATGRLRLPQHVAAAPAAAAVPTPSLAGVLPSLAGVRVPAVPGATASGTAASGTAASGTAASGTAASGTATNCTDDMLGLTLTGPASATAGGAAAFTLTVVDTSPLPCTRAVGAPDAEVVVLDAAGARVWSSADCAPAASSGARTLAAGERVDLPVAWDGRRSAPGCTGDRAAAPAGSYQLRARLGTRTAGPVALTLA